MKKTNKFSPEVRERAVRMVQQQRGEYRRRFGFATTRLSCFISRCTTFSEIVTSCLVSEACSQR